MSNYSFPGSTPDGDFEFRYKGRKNSDFSIEARGIRTGIAISFLAIILVGIFKPEFICYIFCK